MELHVFGDEAKQKIILIHGVLTPWQIWERQIAVLQEAYCVIAVALDAHEEERASTFVSMEQEAKQIEEIYLARFGKEVFAVCGLSMGGAIAHLLWKNQNLKIQRLVMDGAPLVPFGRLLNAIMTKNYLDIIHKSKKRDGKTLENFKRYFLPERYLESFLKIADRMDDASVKNMITSVSTSRLSTDIPSGATKVLFLHGTKGNEVLAMKSAKGLKKYYPETKVVCFQGCTHCYKAIYEPDAWLEVVEAFLAQ